MRSKKWVRKLFMATIPVAMIIPMLVACTTTDEVKPGQERVLRIGVVSGGNGYDSYFRSEYTDLFEFSKQGAVSIEVVPANDWKEMKWNRRSSNGEYEEPDYTELLKKLLTGANPVDVVVLDASEYQAFARDGLLKQIDPLLQKDKIDTNEFVPTVIDGLKAMGDNNLYGLTPTFSSQALFYNKTIFKEAGVEPPTDNMTWEQVFDKAKLVSKGEGKERIYGFSFNNYETDPYSGMDGYVKPLNLRRFDDKADYMTVNTPMWENVWTTFAKLVNEKIVPGADMEMPEMQDEQYNPFHYDDFLSGRAAMVLADYWYIDSSLLEAMKYGDKINGFTKFDWDVVTVPSHAEAPGISGLVSLHNIFAINQKATNPEDAWDFVKFVSSDEWAKLRSRNSGELVSRQKYLKPKDGTDFNIAAFYTMKPVLPTEHNDEELFMMYSNLWEVQEIGSSLFQEVIDKKKSVSDALKEWETKGNQVLKKKEPTPVHSE
ncbi:ABC transporter substrate-binding protein [Paenibacillus dendritiformis]|uniref:ABC transporter substrate-binding protein n=1 Tax=Paenibacillus dendritiformis TaxID=130049 RepID=UPI0036645FE6